MVGADVMSWCIISILWMSFAGSVRKRRKRRRRQRDWKRESKLQWRRKKNEECQKKIEERGYKSGAKENPVRNLVEPRPGENRPIISDDSLSRLRDHLM
jgi:hypothetical protein